MMTTATGDPAMAKTFSLLRQSEGEHVHGHAPRHPLVVQCALSYSPLKGVLDGPAYLAQSMEEKWDIFLFDGALYFARSWTGDLVFAATVAFSGGRLAVSSIVADTTAAGNNPRYIIGQVDFLIKTHLLHSEVPHPLPEGLPDDPDQIAMFSFSQYGRMAAYASFEDTSGIIE